MSFLDLEKWATPESLLQTSGGTLVVAFMAFAFVKGIAKQLLGMVCLGFGFVVGYLVFVNAPAHLQRWFTTVPSNAAIIASIVAGVIVHQVARRLLARMIQPGAGVPDSGGMRMRSAGFSLIPACFWLWVLGMGVRWTGALAQMKFVDEGIRAEQQSLNEEYPLFAQLQSALATGWRGTILNKTDPVSSTEAGALCSLLLVQRDPESWQRLRHDPQVRPILDHPEVQRLLRDKDWSKPASFRNYAELITLPEMTRVLKDQALVEKLRKINVEAIARNAFGATPALE